MKNHPEIPEVPYFVMAPTGSTRAFQARAHFDAGR
jgi:hypothetical protein